MQLLIDRIKEGESAGPWKKIVLPSQLLVRRSVSRLAGPERG